MNTKMISLENKKRYLKWILKNKKLKESEFEHFIVYLVNNDSFLENINFSANVNTFNHSLTLCCTDYMGESVVYKKDKFISFDKQYIFKEIYRQNNLPLCIHFLYDSFLLCEELEKVECEIIEESNLSEEDFVNINCFIEVLELENKKKALLQSLDDALDTKDELLFSKTCDLLEELDNEIIFLKRKGSYQSK